MRFLAVSARPPLRFLARSYLAFVLMPEGEVADWLSELDQHIARSPDFFPGRAVVLDLSHIKPKLPEITDLVVELNRRNIRLMGMEGVDASQLTPELPPLLQAGRTRRLQDVVPPPKPDAPAKPAGLMLDVVRSGQAIHYAEGDITVLGSVGSAAEIVAGGSIHVYGTLRGRVMAGAAGNSSARIFCQRIDAELLGINGYYHTAEDIDVSLRNRPAQVWLDGTDIKITALQ